MNYTETQWADILAAVKLLSEGKPEMVEQCCPGSAFNHQWAPLYGQFTIGGQWLCRPKPQPKTRPWSKQEDVPLNCWIRWVGVEDHHYFIIAVTKIGITVGGAALRTVNWGEERIGELVYSTDRKTWLPCTVEVSQ